jgi:DNA-binding response OmpR family regulator
VASAVAEAAQRRASTSGIGKFRPFGWRSIRGLPPQQCGFHRISGEPLIFTAPGPGVSRGARADARLSATRSPPTSIVGVEILIVEDEAAIADFLERGLSREGFAVQTAIDGVEGERLALDHHFDLVVLDRMLPGRDGLEVLAAIRRGKPALPVIMLTAKSEISDRVEGLNSGAADYVTKPFSFAELAARVKAQLRQPGGQAATTLEAGGIRLDLVNRRAERDHLSVDLPKREAELLAYLMRHAGRVCTHEEIHAAVWNYDHDPGTNIVQVYVGYLRRKLGYQDSPAPIETVRSVGYKLRES